MRAHDDMLIHVQSDWNGWRNANVRLGDLREVHWLQPPGARQALLHGYISCSTIAAGDMPHDCDHTSAPHRLHVCILKRHTIPDVYAELARRADEQRKGPLNVGAMEGVRHGSTPFAERLR
jgi:hypothetical protein